MIAQLNKLEEWLDNNKSKNYLLPVRIAGYLIVFLILMISNFFAIIRWPFASLKRSMINIQDHSGNRVLENEINEVDAKKLKTTLNSQRYVLIDFWAEWCGPCIMMNKPLKRLAKSDSIECTIVKINTVKHKELAKDYNVKGLPTLVLINDNREIKRYTGALSYNEMRDFINN